MKLFGKESTQYFEIYLKNNGFSDFTLMLKAGTFIFETIEKYNYNNLVCIAGPGNNGGDAAVVALQAYLHRKKVSLINLTKNSKKSLEVFNIIKKINLETKNKLPSLSIINKKFIILDGLLGIGLNRKPQGKILNTINWINMAKKRGARIVSIDLPSGVNVDNGIVYTKCVKADNTIMCLTPKKGCYTGKGLEFSGKKHFKRLVDKKFYNNLEADCTLLKTNSSFKYRYNNYSYKGNFGKVLVIGGWDGMPGAGNLTCLASLRSGAGKVYFCSNNFSNLSPEIIRINNTLEEIKKNVHIFNVVVAGPGLGDNATEILKFIWKKNIPLVLDADALIWLAKNFTRKRKANLICTPHYGEAKKLLNRDFEDRFQAIHDLKLKYGGKWILKGPGTLILNRKLFINNFANNILSTSGTGDVLAGIIGGLVAQKVSEPEVKSVLLHTLCARKLIEKGKKTLVAGDLIKILSSIVK